MRKEKIKELAYIMLSVACISYINPIWHTFLHADDFINSMSLYDRNTPLFSRIIQSFGWALNSYKGWQGTYFQNIVHALFSPLNGKGIIQLKLFLIVSFILFVLGLLALGYSICELLQIESRKYLIWCILPIIVLNWIDWSENFYWFTSAAGYTIPLSLGLLGIYFANKKHICIAALLVFCSAGGSLQVSGSICLLCLLFALINDKRIADYLVFAISLLGSIINVVAPGNYARHELIDSSGIHIGWAIKTSISSVLYELNGLIDDGFVIGFLVVLCISTYLVDFKVNKKTFCVIILLCIEPFISIFPVLLGSQSYANRNQSILKMWIVVAVIAVAMVLGQLIKKIDKKYLFAYLYVLLMLFIIVKNDSNNRIINNYKNTKDGLYKDYAIEIQEIYEQIEKEDNADVIIIGKPQPIEGYYNSGLNDDPKSFENEVLAKYYRKNTIVVK